ncbi:MAG TPA: hypothetical protein VN224_13265, partial [Xanthomonadales bacterium]|nr:hypothetical protein [Xanthomonadales bacterium]
MRLAPVFATSSRLFLCAGLAVAIAGCGGGGSQKSAIPAAPGIPDSAAGLQAPPRPASMANAPALPAFTKPTLPDALAAKTPQLTAERAQAMLAQRTKAPAGRATGFFASEASLGPDGSGNIAYYLPALGYYTYGSPTPGARPYNGWLYKYGFGWIFDLGSTTPGAADVYFYDLDLGFIYTATSYGSDPNNYFYFYDFALGHNMVYFQSFNFPRSFYDYNTGKFVTSPPVATNYVKGVSGVAQIPQISSNTFSSSMLGASADGTFVIQSNDSPGRPSGSSFTLTEYNVTASESAAGVTTSASKARVASSVGFEGTNARLPFRSRVDALTPALQRFHGRSTLTVLPGSGGRSVQSVRRVSDLAVNSQRTFHVQQGTITGVGGTCTSPQITIGPYCYIDRSSHLLAVGSHAYVWVDDAIDASYSLTQTDWNATSATFDADFARETAAFAPAFNAGLRAFDGTNSGGPTYTQCGANGAPLQQSFPPYKATQDLSGADPHVSILITNALENTGEGGYFDFLNMLNDQEWNCAYGSSAHVPSNNLPMFVIGTDKYGSSADENYWRTQDMPRSVPHEFQHYLHALNKVLVPDLVNQTGNGQFDDSFVDEGDSMLAEDLVLGSGANPPQSPDSALLGWEYMFTPGNYSLTAFAGYDADPLSTSSNPPYGFFRSTAGNYGGAYLFARYLYDRFGGDAALHRVYGDLTSAPSSGANVFPIQAEANGESFAQVYGEFAGALAARNSASADPRFMFGSNVLLDGLTTVQIPGGATWNLRFNGPRSPQDLTSSTPGSQPRIKLTPGGNVTMKLITGATLFPNVAAGGGAVVTGSVSGAPGFGVNSMMVQGAYH